jgi:hypothetical protein
MLRIRFARAKEFSSFDDAPQRLALGTQLFEKAECIKLAVHLSDASSDDENTMRTFGSRVNRPVNRLVRTKCKAHKYFSMPEKRNRWEVIGLKSSPGSFVAYVYAAG